MDAPFALPLALIGPIFSLIDGPGGVWFLGWFVVIALCYRFNGEVWLWFLIPVLMLLSLGFVLL